MTDALLIVGASARAAACSAMRAGFRPHAVDLFTDRDLQACCVTRRITGYPRQLFAAARTLPPSPWIYTGGLENHPRLVDRLAAERPLFGNPGRVLRAVRDPMRVRRVLTAAHLRFPESFASAGEIPTADRKTGLWLRKPRRSSGGHGVTAWDPDATASPSFHPSEPHRRERGDHIWQRRIAGDSCSAVFVAAAGQGVLLGVTRQWTGTSWTGASEFGYAGSIGPLSVAGPVLHSLRALGHVLARQLQLVGLFGVDFVLDGEEVWTIEVNPRYTASIEVLERALSLQSIAAHVAACREGRLPGEWDFRGSHRCAGKAILYARRALRVGDWFEESAVHVAHEWPPIADVPALGDTIDRGWPICTLLAEGPDMPTVESSLRARAAEYEQRIYNAEPLAITESRIARR